ncbi:uncharacterized protein LOC119370697 [Jatropha curcas]|uniref:uncharacterized protein LOC119370697 n=1 Tax=Jatropha curcas TaxID=180498 RepID=UPI001893EF37|nr:uncharacterized protein LOC119370697 [Jatropha curcas]
MKQVKMQTLRREFEALKMKDGESIKDYSARVLQVVNQLRINREEISDQRVVEKILITLPDKYESKVAAIEESHDLSKYSVTELTGAFQVSMEGAFQAKIKLRESDVVKYPPCRICKRTNHEEKDCWHKGKPQCFKCKRFGHVQKNGVFTNR